MDIQTSLLWLFRLVRVPLQAIIEWRWSATSKRFRSRVINENIICKTDRGASRKAHRSTSCERQVTVRANWFAKSGVKTWEISHATKCGTWPKIWFNNTAHGRLRKTTPTARIESLTNNPASLNWNPAAVRQQCHNIQHTVRYIPPRSSQKIKQPTMINHLASKPRTGEVGP